MRHWQLGYRINVPYNMRYLAPYTDLPEFEATEEAAFAIQSKLTIDFPSAEWRLIECMRSGRK